MKIPSKIWRLCVLIPCCLLLAACQQDVTSRSGTASASTSTASGSVAASASDLPAKGENGNSSSNTSSNPLEIPRATQGSPQPKLATLRLWVGTNEVTAEIAHTLPQIMTGMMWRTNMNEMDGMLFVMPQAQRVGFWMRNTLLPLSCAYIDPEGTILELHDMKPRDETPITAESDQVQFVLEMKQGWFERHNVKPGMLIASDRGTLAETFLRRR